MLPGNDCPACSAYLCAEPALREAPGDSRPPDLCFQHAALVMRFRDWTAAPDEDRPADSLAASLAWWEIDDSQQL
jgi:hypothetical protein